MKKRVLSLLLVVAMLASLVVFPAYANESDVCSHCGVEVEWKSWTGELVEGYDHYILESNIVTDTLVLTDTGFTLDLNGYTWSATSGKRLLEMGTLAVEEETPANNCEVTILDTSVSGLGQMQATGKNGEGFGVVLVADNATLNIVGGTLRQLPAADVVVSHGGVLGAQENAKVNISGGKITDGYVVDGTTALGGNVYIDGEANVQMSNGKIVNGRALAGAGVHIASGTFKMTGGEISNNIAYKDIASLASANGGNINNVGGTLAIEGTTAVIKNGVAGAKGGNIYSAYTFTLKNIDNNIKGDIYSHSHVTLYGRVNIPMGNSHGLLTRASATACKVKFGADFDANSVIYFTRDQQADNGSSAFTDTDAADYVNCFRGVGRTYKIEVTSGTTTLTAYCDYGKSGSTNQSYCPHCKQLVTWFRFSAISLTNLVKTPGHYIVNGNASALTFATAGEYVIDISAGNFAVNGRFANITAKNVTLNIIDTRGGGKISGKGLASVDGSTHKNNGGVINVADASYAANVNIYSGTIHSTLSTGTQVNRGGIIGMNGGNVTIKGGILADGKTGGSPTTGTATKGNGGTMYMNNGVFTMTGGLITGGDGSHGGNVYVNSNANAYITGGIIEDGQSTGEGGNLYLTCYNDAERVNKINNALIRGGTGASLGGNVRILNGHYEISNTSITAGTGTTGGNIHDTNAAKFTLSNAFIYGGNATTGSGGNLSIAKAITYDLDNVIISGGKAEAGNGGNIYLSKAATLDTNNCMIAGGTAKVGGNIQILDSIAGKLDLDNTIITDGTATNGNGGNIYAKNASAKLDMYNVEVSNGTVPEDATTKGRGGNIYFNDGEVKIDTCTLKDGRAYYGGNLYVNGKTTLKDVTSIGGYATDAGGGIYHNGAAEVSFENVTATGGTTGTAGAGGNIRLANGCTVTKFKNVKMYDGEAKTGGNLHVFSVKGSIHLEDVTAEGGIATENGGNICVADVEEAFTMTNCTVSKGQAKSNGGNIYIDHADKAVCTDVAMTNCTVSEGTATTGDGGNIYFGKNISDDEITLTNCTVKNGRAKTATEITNIRTENIVTNKGLVLDNVKVSSNSGMNNVGSGVHATSKTENIIITLKNGTEIGSEKDPLNGALYLHYNSVDVKVTDEETGDEKTEKVTYTAQLKVDSTFSGHAVVNVYTIVDAGHREDPYGQETLNIELVGDKLNGKLYVGDHRTGSGSGYAIWSVGMPQILVNKEGNLQVASGATLVNENGTQFFPAPAEAFGEYTEGDVLKLVGDLVEGTEGAFDLKANTTYKIDINGKMVSVNGNATNKIIGIDSANAKDLTTDGALTVNGDVAVESVVTEGGKHFIAVADSNVYGFHNISMDITKVTLRTNKAGIFYKGQWTCDDKLETYLKSLDTFEFGVVVSTTDMPEADFATENTEDATPNLYSAYGPAAFSKNAEVTGVCVTNIMNKNNTPADNTANCSDVIYARAYIYLGEENGYLVDGEGAALNLLDVAKKIDDKLTEDNNFATQDNRGAMELMNEFYGIWKDLGLKDAKDNYTVPFTTIFQDVEEA